MLASADVRPTDPTDSALSRRPSRSSRRSPWDRPRDRILAAVLAVVCAAAVTVVWLFSDSRATEHRTASVPPPRLDPPAAVAGRDPLTGEIRWSYSRDLELCTVAGAWSKAVAVYRKDLGCSEVTQLDPSTGRRTAQRNGDAEAPTRLVVDDAHVTTTGERLLNTWRSDLVQTMEYGRVPAPENPQRQPRSGCRYSNVSAGADKVGVIEHCPKEVGARLTVLKAAGEESDEPEQVFSTLLAEPTAQLVAMSEERVAVALPEQRRLLLFDYEGEQRSSHDIAVPTAELATVPDSGVVPVSSGRENVYWFTGSHTVALSAGELRPRWIAENTLGPGTVFAGEYVVPIPGGLAVLDERTGATTRTVAVDRRGHDGSIELEAIGPVLIEQRGRTLVALR